MLDNLIFLHLPQRLCGQRHRLRRIFAKCLGGGALDIQLFLQGVFIKLIGDTAGMGLCRFRGDIGANALKSSLHAVSCTLQLSRVVGYFNILGIDTALRHPASMAAVRAKAQSGDFSFCFIYIYSLIHKLETIYPRYF